MKRILIVALLARLLPFGAQASFISIRTDAAAHVDGSNAIVTVRTTNLGDEDARNLIIESLLGVQRVSGPTHPVLARGQNFEERLELKTLPPEPGQYSILVKTHYADANVGRFTALSVVPLRIGETRAVDLVIAGMPNVALLERGVLQLKLKALEDRDVDVNVRLMLPDELSCSNGEQSLLLFPRQNRRVDFAIENVAGKPGSSYAVFAVLDYSVDKCHNSVVTSGVVSIPAPKPLFAGTPWAWTGVVILLLIAVIVIQVHFARPQPGA